MRKNCLDICDTNMAYGRHTIDAWKMPEENNITKGAYPGQMPLYSEMLKCYTGVRMIRVLARVRQERRHFSFQNI